MKLLTHYYHKKIHIKGRVSIEPNLHLLSEYTVLFYPIEPTYASIS